MEKTDIEESGSTNVSRFGPGLTFKGELSGQGDVIIEGQYKGKIDLGDHNLMVGRNGVVEADINAHNVMIKGFVKGNVTALGKVVIEQGSQIIGDISAPRIQIMDGAQFKGSVKMAPPIP